ncbi:MAG: metallophosphoesterase [Lachnospiraceae bacterium]|nr:metallophosphoesterase [Lachnospiraceae bacterium]
MADILITILVVAFLVLLWIMLYDSNRFVVRRYRVRDRKICRKVRAVVLADLHNKQYGKENERLLAAIAECEPDLVLVAGDMITAHPGKKPDVAVRLMNQLAEKYPVYYGNGNHEQRLKLYPDTYKGLGEQYSQALEQAGISPLVNSSVMLQEYGIAVYGLEIDRFYYRRCREQPMEAAYLDSVLGQADPSVYNVLLAHNPDYFPQYAEWGADLVCSGHIHGGMVRIPLLGKGVVSPKVRFFPRYDGGVFTEGKSTMILSRGLGMHRIPIRLFNPGELVVVDFLPDQEAADLADERTKD